MTPTKEQLKQAACEAIDKNRDKIIAIGDSIFNEPELGFKEFKTAERVKRVFDEIGLPYRSEVAITGVIAPLKGAESKIKVAVMAELDAVVSPTHRCANPDTGAAHACAHNCMVAALSGVAYALGSTDIMSHLSGDVDLMAVPAEEYVELEYRKKLREEGKIQFMGGKQEFIRLGVMDDVDIMVMQHNENEHDGKIGFSGYSSNGFIGKLIQYKGKAAHAGGYPHLGVNALNAANLGLMAVSYQRETFQEKDRIRVHPIITKGGDLVNVVPDDVHIETYIRGASVEAIFDAEKKVDRAFKAGGDAVGAETIITTFPGYMPFMKNKPLMDIAYENQKQILGEDKVMYEMEPMAHSSDAGDISVLMPTLQCGFAGVSGTFHGNEVEITDKEIAYIAAAKCLAMTVIDLLYDGAAAGIKVKEEFKPVLTKEEYLRDWGKL